MVIKVDIVGVFTLTILVWNHFVHSSGHQKNCVDIMPLNKTKSILGGKVNPFSPKKRMVNVYTPTILPSQRRKAIL